MNYWHIQLHPNKMNWGVEENRNILSKNLIGCSGKPIAEFYKIQKGDRVLVRHGAKVIALVEVIGSPKTTPESIKNEWIWFTDCCEVEVLAYCENLSVKGKGWYLPTTLQQIKKSNETAHSFIENLYNEISK